MPKQAAIVDQLLRDHAAFGFSGAAALIDADGPVLRAGYGCASHRDGRTCTPSTVFDIGSVSKQFTATAVVLLAERGRLDFDDPIGRHLPGVPADKKAITVHHLLTHWSGVLRNHSDTDFVEMTLDEAVDRILQEPLRRLPGLAFEYSNSGYTLLAALVEQVSGTPYITFMREEFFDALGMDRTGFYRDFPEGECARGYDGYDGSLDHGSPAEWIGPSFAVVGNGAVISCIDDLIKWESALRSDELLSPASRRLLETPHTEEYGYGWRVERSETHGRIARHGGANAIFNCEYWRLLDQDLTLLLLANRSSEECMLLPPIVDRVLVAMTGRQAPDPPPDHDDTPSSEDLTGTWAADDGNLTIYQRDGRTHLTAVGESLLARISGVSPSIAQDISELVEEARHVREVGRGPDTVPQYAGFLHRPTESGTHPVEVARAIREQAAQSLTEDTLSEFEVIGTVHAGPFDQYQAYATYLRLTGAKGQQSTIRLLWLGGANLGGVLASEREPLQWVVRPHPTDGYRAYDPMTGETARIVRRADHLEVSTRSVQFTVEQTCTTS